MHRKKKKRVEWIQSTGLSRELDQNEFTFFELKIPVIIYRCTVYIGLCTLYIVQYTSFYPIPLKMLSIRKIEILSFLNTKLPLLLRN